jgi:hypothetical protein
MKERVKGIREDTLVGPAKPEFDGQSLLLPDRSLSLGVATALLARIALTVGDMALYGRVKVVTTDHGVIESLHFVDQRDQGQREGYLHSVAWFVQDLVKEVVEGMKLPATLLARGLAALYYERWGPYQKGNCMHKGALPITLQTMKNVPVLIV